MRTIDIDEAKAKLSELIDQASDGEEIVIERAGVPVAKLVAHGLVVSKTGKRVLGRLRGQLTIPENFDDLCSEEIQALFEGRADADSP